MRKMKGVNIWVNRELTWTVFLTRCEGPGCSGEYISDKNIELINVLLPKPLSPGKKTKQR